MHSQLPKRDTETNLLQHALPDKVHLPVKVKGVTPHLSPQQGEYFLVLPSQLAKTRKYCKSSFTDELLRA